MRRHLRTAVLVVLVLAGSCASAGAALAAIAPGCANPVDSALNQGCDTIPGPTGARAPHAGSLSLATALARGIVTRIESPTAPVDGQARHSGRQARARRRALLSLPAPGPRARLSSSRATITEASLMPVWLIVVVVGLAAALTSGTGAVRYRRRGGD